MSRVTILAVFAAFLAPVIIAVLLHSQWFDWRPDQTRNHGELIDPPAPLPSFELLDADGRPVTREDLLDQWQLLHVSGGACGESCVESLYWMRQVRRAQDRHQSEIALMLATPEALDPEARQAIEALEADIRIFPAQAGQAFIRYLPDTGEAPISYILDPMANIILRYPADSDFNGMRRDLSRLLTWTRTDRDTGNPDTSDP